MAHVPAAERRPQLVKAAIDLMRREGIAAGSTRAIATELGVAQATVHYTFGTKEGLYQAVLTQVTSTLVDHVRQAAPDGGSFAETVAAMVAALWHTVREQPADYQLLNELILFAERTPALSDASRQHYREVIEVTAELIEQAATRTGQRLAQPALVLSRFFLAGFEGLTAQRVALPDEASEQACLGSLVAAVVALATGQLTPVVLAQPV
ncbi:AcrR family transcriptional regulator [Crossiella equi]|uniref:AcrR family transcriptional regulator n=1 Tax=Crossiella equi TaxID=130796 RepID=A0ABS5AS49_9PSEU|nr:TetR/AcrR family transcriptional regulator [Crossiella equi]MBP2479414.1 AcrR family transcriptional regulator [Crossiella equi]